MLTITIIATPIIKAQTNSNNKVELYFFWGKGCPHCAQTKPFLEGLKKKYPTLEVKEYEVYFNKSNRELADKIARAYGGIIEGVPTIFINDKMIVGFNEKIAGEIESEVKYCEENKCLTPLEVMKNSSLISRITNSKEKEKNSETKGIIVFSLMIIILAASIIGIILLNKKEKKKKRKN